MKVGTGADVMGRCSVRATAFSAGYHRDPSPSRMGNGYYLRDFVLFIWKIYTIFSPYTNTRTNIVMPTF